MGWFDVSFWNQICENRVFDDWLWRNRDHSMPLFQFSIIDKTTLMSKKGKVGQSFRGNKADNAAGLILYLSGVRGLGLI